MGGTANCENIFKCYNSFVFWECSLSDSYQTELVLFMILFSSSGKVSRARKLSVRQASSDTFLSSSLNAAPGCLPCSLYHCRTFYVCPAMITLRKYPDLLMNIISFDTLPLFFSGPVSSFLWSKVSSVTSVWDCSFVVIFQLTVFLF